MLTSTFRALVVLVVSAVVLALPGVGRADCKDPFGKPNQLLDFHIKMKRADWTALLASRVPSTDGNRGACDAKYPEFPAEFRCGTEDPWLVIALRKKRGEERGVEAPLKPPMKIDINEDFMGKVPAAKGQRWPASFGELGYRKLTLNNGQGNKAPGRTLMLPNLLSEHVALRLLHREVPSSPATALAKVTMYFEDKPEGEYHGTYLLVEDIDRTAIKRRWGRADGRLVKASKAGCPQEVQYDDGPPNASKAAYDAWVGRAGTYEEAAKALDVDATLRQEAIREILVNGDDTLFFAGGEGNNWYSFDPREGKRQFMPWDVDLTFGQQQQNCAPNSLKCPFTFPILTWCNRNVSRPGRALACNPQIQKRYLEMMCQLTNGSLSADEILKVWIEADATARPGVALEKELIWRGMDPLSTAVDKSYGAEFERLKAWIPQRIRSVQQQITAKGVACSPGCTAGASEPCTYLTCAGERRCENNLWSVCRPTGVCAAGAAPDGGVPPTPGPGGAADAGGSGSGSGGAGGPGPGAGTPGTGGASGSAPVTPGTAGATGSAPATPGGGKGTGGASGDPVSTPAAESASGCQCALGTRGSAPGPAAWLPGLLLAGLVIRRRGRPGRDRPTQ